MASAIVRNRIANSTINSIMKERTVIRDALRAEMAKTCEGWGIWLETIEITDVKIMSSTLFAHMQTQFSEQQRKIATLQKREVDDQIWVEQEKHGLETAKRSLNTAKDTKFRAGQQRLISEQAELDKYLKDVIVEKQKIKRLNTVKEQTAVLDAERQRVEIEIAIEQRKNEILNEIANEVSLRDTTKA